MAGWVNPEMGGTYSLGKAAIVDPSDIGPDLDFANIPVYENREDAIIYEVHPKNNWMKTVSYTYKSGYFVNITNIGNYGVLPKNINSKSLLDKHSVY